MKWEYKKILTSPNFFEREANNLGEDGWELIGFSVVVERGDARCMSVFKRQLRNE